MKPGTAKHYEQFIGCSTLHRCDGCGQVERCISNIMDRTYLCYACHLKRMEEESRAPMKPFPVAELKHGGLMPLDVEDFASTY